MTAVRIHNGRLEARGTSPKDRARLVALRDLWDERAGILENQAGFSRAEAEARALAELLPMVEKVAA